MHDLKCAAHLVSPSLLGGGKTKMNVIERRVEVDSRL
jgi:hypothetical protein